MRPRNLGCPAAVLLLASTASGHDDVHGTRSEQLYERSHEVRVSLHRGHAELRVRRRVENLGPRHDQAMFWITPPEGGVATGLRTLGTAGGKPQWFAGDLMEAEAAAARYRELTGIGGYYPKDPALLSWRSQSLLLLQVFPVAPNDSKTVEYTFLVPTHYRAGAHRLSLGGLGNADVGAELVLGPARDGDRLLVNDKPSRAGLRLTPRFHEVTELALVPRTREPLGGELAVAATGSRFVTHLSIEAAPKVSSVPRGARVVVVIDASRSLSDAAMDAQKAALAATLGHFPDAAVEVLTFDRRPHRRYGKLEAVERVRRDLLALPIERRNGSAVDEALLEAERILAAGPPGKPRRILVVSDTLVRSSLKPERIRAALGASGAIVHLGVPSAGAPELRRDDRHPWAAALRSTGGLVWNASASDDADHGAQMHAVYEEWARPVRVDHLTLFSPDLALGTTFGDLPVALDEGEGIEQLLFTTRDVAWVRVEGELWSRPVQRVIHADAAAGKRWAALVFGSPLLDELSEPEMTKLAFHGGAVSPVTSYLAIEPGVRPSTEGLDWGGGSGSGFGNGAAKLRMGTTGVTQRVAPIDRDRWLRDHLLPSFVACGGKPGTARLSLETTFAEVVDVPRVDLGGLRDPLLERCIREAAWDLVLPAGFDAEWTTWSVAL